MKKHVTLVLVAALLLAALPAASTQARQAPSLLIWADETRAPVIEELGASFEEEYGVDLVVQQLDYGGIRDQVKIAGPAGEGPDILIGGHDWLGELVTNGMLAEVDLGDAAEGFAPSAIAAMTWDGKLYGVPVAVENVAFFYNTDVVETPPATFDEVRSMSEEIMKSGKAKYGFVRMQGDPYHFYPIQTAFGGYIFGLDELGNYNPEDVGVDNEGSVAALQWLQGMMKDGLIPSGLDNQTADTLFADGESTMYITGPWNIQKFVDAGINFAIAPIPAGPAGPGKPFLGVQAFMVSAFSPNPLLAQAFLTEWVATEDVQYAFYEEGKRAPALIAAQERVEDPLLAGIGAAGIEGQPMPAIPAMSAVWGPWGDAVTLAMQNPDADAATLLAEAGEAIRQAIAESAQQ